MKYSDIFVGNSPIFEVTKLKRHPMMGEKKKSKKLKNKPLKEKEEGKMKENEVKKKEEKKKVKPMMTEEEKEAF